MSIELWRCLKSHDQPRPVSQNCTLSREGVKTCGLLICMVAVFCGSVLMETWKSNALRLSSRYCALFEKWLNERRQGLHEVTLEIRCSRKWAKSFFFPMEGSFLSSTLLREWKEQKRSCLAASALIPCEFIKINMGWSQWVQSPASDEQRCCWGPEDGGSHVAPMLHSVSRIIICYSCSTLSRINTWNNNTERWGRWSRGHLTLFVRSWRHSEASSRESNSLKFTFEVTWTTKNLCEQQHWGFGTVIPRRLGSFVPWEGRGRADSEAVQRSSGGQGQGQSQEGACAPSTSRPLWWPLFSPQFSLLSHHCEPAEGPRSQLGSSLSLCWKKLEKKALIVVRINILQLQ